MEQGLEPPAKPVDTIFAKIIRKEIKADIVYEDDQCLAFRDINAQAPVHILGDLPSFPSLNRTVIPKITDVPQLSKAQPHHQMLLGHLLLTASKIAEQEKLSRGFRIVINDGPSSGQTVYHLHVHILGGRQMNWPPG